MNAQYVRTIDLLLLKLPHIRGNGLLDLGPERILTMPYLGKMFLIVVDAHSKWIDVQIVNSTSAETTISKLRTIFVTHGLPEQLVSDSGSGFTSTQFKEFMDRNGIKHILTSPYHPSSSQESSSNIQEYSQ